MDVITNILIFLFGMFIIYLTSYVKFKGKNKALKEDVAKLEDEKQKTIAKYRIETEELKKQHALDIEKRKFKYEEKRNQFSKYFKLLDEFTGKCNHAFGEKFNPIMSSFLTEMMEADGNSELETNATVLFSKATNSLFFELNEEHLKIKTETNSIRLISSPEIDSFLDELEINVKEATQYTEEMLKFMATPNFWANQALVEPYNNKVSISANKVLDGRNKLREQMKFELNEI